MLFLSIYQASQVPFSPSRVYLSRIAKKEDRPEYFVKDGDSWVVDIEHPSWIHFLENRKEKLEGSKSTSAKIPNNETAPKVETGRSTAELKLQKLEEEVKEKEIRNEILFLEMQKKSGSIIDFNLANYLFFSYMEKACIDFLRLGTKNEARIQNLVREGKTKEIIKLWQNETTAIIREIKKSQKESLDKWEEEGGKKTD